MNITTQMIAIAIRFASNRFIALPQRGRDDLRHRWLLGWAGVRWLACRLLAGTLFS